MEMLGGRSAWGMEDIYKTLKTFRKVGRRAEEPPEKTFIEDRWDDTRTWYDRDVWGV